ncbi:rhamnogalacturonan acetylesterase [Bacillus sp. OK048]|uniref:rhamnogalacturonan acetylesterase n=1 Tax=Bacillus sp. OK048 TaxID=1882761 RepID=UPI00087FAD66|nr:rhamnogalacturonan acetylesterase [Bacillus sp. OK048]SDM43882.1 Lysophospholipase L1 [Bacillus sp. OK048]
MDNVPNRIFLAADSTVQDYDASEKHQGGWGEFLQVFLNEEVRVSNHAIGGRSSKTFIEEGRLLAISKEINAGDYLFIQMGHNDSTKSKPERFTEPFTTYKQFLKMYVTSARNNRAVPVFITPPARMHEKDGKFINDFPEYCAAMKEVALEEKVTLIDLMEKSLRLLNTIGNKESLSLFMASVNGTDFTHFTKKGAYQMAGLVVDGIKESNLPLQKQLIVI